MKQSVHENISATDLVRHFSSVVDKVRLSGQSLYITKGTQTIAELCPPPKTGFPIKSLAGWLKSLPRLEDDTLDMVKGLQTIRNNAKMPGNPWD